MYEIAMVAALLSDEVFGNPHSKNLTSQAMTQRVEQAREYVLKYFNASPEEYIVIFTPNATLTNDTFRAGVGVISGNVMDAVKSVMTCSPDYLVMGMSAITFFGGAKGADAFVRKIEEFTGIGISVGSHSASAALRGSHAWRGRPRRARARSQGAAG